MTEPKLIPIYDDSAPIACTIAGDEVPDRIAVLERMRAALTSLDRTATGLVLHFPDDGAVRADLEAFAVDEKRCCSFWGFEVLDEAGGVALRWDGPPAAGDLLQRLEAFLTGDEPLASLDGLL